MVALDWTIHHIIGSKWCGERRKYEPIMLPRPRGGSQDDKIVGQFKSQSSSQLVTMSIT